MGPRDAETQPERGLATRDAALRVVAGAISLRQWGSHADGAEGVGAELIGDVVSVAAFTAILELSGLAGRLPQELQGGLSGFAERRTAAFLVEQRRALAEEVTADSAGW